MDKATFRYDLLFETSWEVCNKIGGIYTVLSTKARTLQKLSKDNTIFIGPDVWTEENPSPYFIESKTLLAGWRKSLSLPYGIKVRVGRWDIPGKPIVVLVSFGTMYEHKNELYGEMWEKFRVDSLHAYGDYDEACAFSHAAAIVIESICQYNGLDKKYIAHFDEWTTGMGLLYINAHLPQVATVFTTHATSIGRSICGNGKPLYDYLAGYNGDQMAGELNMQSKHSLEKAAAQNADCFTTVSDITATECTQLLERQPDVVTPNGFEDDFVPAKTKFAKVRKEARTCLLSRAQALTGKKYDDDTFIVITSGRCEYRNKGLDLFLDSIKLLQEKNSMNSKFVAFVMVPGWVKAPREDVQEALVDCIGKRVNDPVITHELNNYYQDPIVNGIHNHGFDNALDKDVDVIYVPCYLDGKDGIFDKTYYDLLIGADATVFASYYEPWGYTPLESIAFGVPTITTTLSGFGQWILHEEENDLSKSGVAVIKRNDSNYGEVVTNIADTLLGIAYASQPTRNEYSTAARTVASHAAWSNFISHYADAYEIALKSAAQRNKKKKK